jgi:hypothetical protein
MGPVEYAAGTVQLWYIVIYCRLSWIHQHALFSLQGSFAELCLPLAGSGPINHVAFWQSCAHARSVSTASVFLLARQPCWTLLTSFVTELCLLSTNVFDKALHMSKFFLSLFSYWSPTAQNGVFNSAIMNNDFMSFATQWIERRHLIRWHKLDSQRQKLHFFSHLWNLEQGKTWKQKRNYYGCSWESGWVIWKDHRGWIWSKYRICMHGNVTVKSLSFCN